MTREEAIVYGNDYYADLISACCKIDEKHKEFVRMSLEALEQEPCEDCISRAQALSDYADWYGYGYRDNTFYKRLKNMPSAQPKQKPDRWEIVPKSEFDSSTNEHIRCTNCGKEPFGDIPYLYCPNCGARMEDYEET